MLENFGGECPKTFLDKTKYVFRNFMITLPGTGWISISHLNYFTNKYAAISDEKHKMYNDVHNSIRNSKFLVGNP